MWQIIQLKSHHTSLLLQLEQWWSLTTKTEDLNPGQECEHALKPNALRLALFSFLFLVLNLIELNHWRHWSTGDSLYKASTIITGTPPEEEMVYRGHSSVMLHQPFAAAQSLGQSADLGRSMHIGHPCLFTFLFPGHTPATPDCASTNPACGSALPTPLCPNCQGKENQVQRSGGRDMLQQVTNMYDIESTPRRCFWPYRLHWVVSSRYNSDLPLPSSFPFKCLIALR